MPDDNTVRTVFGKWLVFAFSIFTFGTGFGTPVSLSVMFLDWQDTFSVTRTHTAVVHSTSVSILLGGGVLAGYVMNRIGARLTILIGSALASTGMFVSAFATSINFLVVSVGIVSGFGFCFVQLPVIPCVTSVTRYKTLVISLCLSASGVFSIVNRIFVRCLVDQYSWRGACIIIAGIALHSCVGGMIITSVINPPKDLLLAKKEENKNLHLDYEIRCNNGNTVTEHGSTSSLKEPESKTNQNKDGDFTQLPEIPTDPINLSNKSKDNPHAVVCESDITLVKNRRDFKTERSNHRGIPHGRNNESNSSIWRFFTDVMFVLLTVHVAICVASLFSFCLILMDFSRTLGFDKSTGVLFLNITFASSIIGRLAVGIFGDFFSNVHSFVIQTLVAIPGSLALLILAFNRDRIVVICLLTIVGISVGGLVVIYPKCTLDVKSVDKNSYPIAFGFLCTIEGIMGLLSSIAIGLSVDMTGSYVFILVVIGCGSLLSTILLGCGYFFISGGYFFKCQQQQSHH